LSFGESVAHFEKICYEGVQLCQQDGHIVRHDSNKFQQIESPEGVKQVEVWKNHAVIRDIDLKSLFEF